MVDVGKTIINHLGNGKNIPPIKMVIWGMAYCTHITGLENPTENRYSNRPEAAPS
jgi:hypothetical protein